MDELAPRPRIGDFHPIVAGDVAQGGVGVGDVQVGIGLHEHQRQRFDQFAVFLLRLTELALHRIDAVTST